ncbi:MAG: sialate O-acetylesterase, partial [Flavobacteriaceae bacterium]
ARRLQGELNVPIGLIDSSWGATCAEVWTPEDVFEDNADLKEAAKKVGANPWVTTQPSSLYNALIAPLKNFPIAGTIWYQGESNTANADTYQKLFGKMISAWRNQWGTDFPFYYVQIAPFNYDSPEVGVQVRDAQRRILESIDNTGMVVVSDICTIDDIHPQNKQDVGLRMANLALNHHYKTIDGQVNGPLFKEMKIDGKQVHVFFDHAKGLTSTTKNVGHFEMAGADGKFFPATAKIKNDMVILTSKSVSIPANVRFAWSNTDMATLFNEVGLPASSFTTEEWSH